MLCIFFHPVVTSLLYVWFMYLFCVGLFNVLVSLVSVIFVVLTGFLFIFYVFISFLLFVDFSRRMEIVKYTGRTKDKEHEEKFALFIEVSTKLVDEVLRGSQVHIRELSSLLRWRFHHTLVALHPDWRCAHCKSRARGAVNGMMLVWNQRPLHVIDHVLPVCVAGGVCMRKLVEEFRKYPELLPMLIF